MRSPIPLLAFALALSAPALGTELVPVPQFRSVEVFGGGEITVVPGPAQRVTVIEGSTRVTQFRVDRDSLRIDACNQECPRRYRLRIEIQSPQVPGVAVTGGGMIRVGSGFAAQPDLSAAIKGGGKIDARAVDAGHVSAAVDGGGQIVVRPHSTLAAAVRGGGEIRYSGNPQVTSAIMGGGWIGRD
jgi:hypothetical protein